MAFGDGVRNATTAITVGQVHHHVVKSEVVLRCPSHSPLADFVKNLRKGVRNDNNSLSTDLLHRDGHSFAFILHYIITGDLVYPLHQGFHRVDALLKELTFYGLVEDVIRNATQDGSARGKSNKRRHQSLFGAEAPRGAVKSEPVKENADPTPNPFHADGRPRSASLSKRALSFQNIADLDDVKALNLAKHSVSMNSLVLDADVKGCADAGLPPSTKCQQQRVSLNGHRFLAIVKRYLSLKSTSKAADHTIRKSKSCTPTLWSPRDGGGGGGGGVFRPTCAQGATLVLVAEPDYVTVFGQRSQLELIFPDCHVVPLRTTSSALIDAQLVYQPDEERVVDGDESASDLDAAVPKRSSSAEILWRLYRHRIQARGFNLTVQSQWRDRQSLGDHHQWLLYKKNNAKSSSSSSSSTTGQRRPINGSVASLNPPLSRKTSVLQRLFQRSTLTVHLTSDAICE